MGVLLCAMIFQQQKKTNLKFKLIYKNYCLDFVPAKHTNTETILLGAVIAQ